MGPGPDAEREDVVEREWLLVSVGSGELDGPQDPNRTEPLVDAAAFVTRLTGHAGLDRVTSKR